MDTEQADIQTARVFPMKKWIAIFFVVLFLIIAISVVVPPADFPVDTPVPVESGESIQGFAAKLEKGGYIKNSTLFTLLFVTLGNNHTLNTGYYSFERPLGIFGVVHRFIDRDFGVYRLKLTFPEGVTRYEMTEIVQDKIPTFSAEEFLEATKYKEGYLFPDTYYFFFGASVAEIAKTLEDTYSKKTAHFSDDIEKSVHTEHEIITMASILEREANTGEEQHIVSGILWKRIRIGMPMQVDATFAYLLGKTSSELTLDDLETDSPYNTYNNKGLPPGPIGNPGLSAIDAALHPVESNYLYYLHDDNGTIHYGRDFEEHKRNKSLYLN